MRGAAKRIAVEAVGWLLVVAGVAALILPGPGLLMIAGGLVILSQQYEWAERRVEPVKREALRGAAKSVETWPRIVVTLALFLAIVGCAILWFVGPDVPGWWPLPDAFWLPGGKVTSITWFLSAVIVLALLVWSYRTYHGNPEAIAAAEEAARGDDSRAGFWGR